MTVDTSATALATLSERIATVRDRIAEAALASGRVPSDVTIVAVSKMVSRPAVEEAAELGLRHFGENRVQEARDKFAEGLPHGAALHLVGQLQSNKARHAARLFDRVESVDRPSLVEALDRAAAKTERPLSVLLQVNVAGERQKAGCAVDDALPLAWLIVASPHLRLDGLMTVAPLVADPEATRPVFAGLRELRDRLRELLPEHPLSVLSMGMSNDFAVAIAEGATHVRIGRAIFGER